jgi:hypothetical protein
MKVSAKERAEERVGTRWHRLRTARRLRAGERRARMRGVREAHRRGLRGYATTSEIVALRRCGKRDFYVGLPCTDERPEWVDLHMGPGPAVDSERDTRCLYCGGKDDCAHCERGRFFDEMPF